MNEITIELAEINPTEFYGGKSNKNVALLKKCFPKIKIVVRGNKITAFGEEELLEHFEKQVDRLVMHYGKYNTLDDDTVLNILQSEEDDTFGLDPEDNKVILHGVGGKIIKAKTLNQAKLVTAMSKNDMVFAVGPAGTGKTYTGVALAVKALKNKQVKRIILTRPAVEAGENLGFLPGDLKEKLDPYMQPLYDALRDMIPAEKLDHYIENGIIQIAPMAFMRGRTLDNAFVILDEAQNTTHEQMMMFLTRLGDGSRMVVTGDITQTDLPRNKQSGLKEATRVLKDIDRIRLFYFDGQDVVRHPLVQDIINAYAIA